MTPADVSVIIPTLNEEAQIAESINSAFNAGAKEVIVVDGGSSDKTLVTASDTRAKFLSSKPGRGAQLNCGFQAATGKYVLFLHADNRLSEDCLQQVCDADDPVWGAFQQAIQANGVLYRLLERGNATRVKLRRMPFGDQAVFVRTDTLREIGGVAELPLMEDVDLAQRLRRIAPPLLLPGPVSVDARRWQKRGVIRQTARNWFIQIAHTCGVSPQRLRTWYR